MSLTSLKRRSRLDPQLARFSDKTPINMKRVAAIILGGGQGSRLFPLTTTYCKPAAPVGGRYRLIDIPISNAINSGCSKIFIITQFLSASLLQHIYTTYQLGTFSSGLIELLPAEQRPDQESWFKGTADAVRKNLHYFNDLPVDYFLILSGDQLYNMNFQHMLDFAQETNADLVISSFPIAETEAQRMGVLKVNDERFVEGFQEKPQSKELLHQMRIPESTLWELTGKLFNIDKQYLASMGIYLFKRKALLQLLLQDLREDFGKHLIPTLVKQGKVAAFVHDGYWEDIGTIGSYFKANIALTLKNSPLNCYDENNPIISKLLQLPPPKISNTHIEDSLICEGSIVEADLIKNSILGPRTIVKEGTIIKNSYIMGHDFYKSNGDTEQFPEQLQIDENCLIDHAIIDKHVYLGKGVQLVNKKRLTTYNSEQVFIRDGIIIVKGGARIPNGYIL